ncbi:CusA/CzcA family heavy metal efflux RND transporter [Glaciimonas sp. Gout2]|uniref:efflux RND transporter permease subunit n=1 Tax=unclassified Glaciimonas TaxID=2644401 RepID=UPI002B22CB7D|nr:MULTISPECIES: CusA/CzcA family heavy metal efflux RND transporter [unclassified Glaciimonas]MEB0014132.1 CusA/CzcA family heavy metal efflux RND transporter [Glaciimonas sp. Cout2]MEB0083475.1 CusA/CzcA family heavy metal efflux RND transporter [Glaciimonas sp. Gout2]
MINNVVRYCLQKRYAVILVTILVALFGYYSWTRMAVEAYPELSDVSAQVTTQAPGLAAEEIEQQITIPLERQLSGTPGLVHIRSSSTFGLSLITLTFKDGAEDYWERQRVTERIALVTMPTGITPTLDSVSGPSGEIYRYTLESDSKNLMELSEIQRWIVIPELRQIPGIADVGNFGGMTMEYQLEIDQNQLQRFGVSLPDVTTAINNNNANAGGSRISRGEQGYVVRGLGMMRSLTDLGNVVVKQVSGVPVLVRDLGKLQYSHQERQGILGKDNNPDTIEGIVKLLKYQNASEVIKDVHAKVAQLQKQLAPQGVRIVPYIDRDELIQLTVHKVSHTVLEGIGLVCIVLILFLGSPRSALVAAVTIPLALVAVFIMMYLTKMPANLFSLGAIDFGIIVDGAIVVTEAILRRREAKPTEELTEIEVRAATTEVIKPIFFATLIIISAYLPLFAFERAEGKLLSPMAFTVSYALIGALICSIVLVPGLAYMALRKPRKIFHNKPLEWLSTGYRNTLGGMLNNPSIAYVIGVVALVGVIALGAVTGREFMPQLDEGTLWLQVQMPSGLSLEKGSEMAAELRRTLLSFPEVSYVVTQLGRSDDGTDPWTPSHMEVPVGLKPYNTWPPGENKADFVRRLNARLVQLPGFSIGISQPISDGVNDAVGGAHSPLVIRIYGEDFKELRRIGNNIVDVLHGVRGSADVSIFQEPPIPQMVIDIDRAAAARLGINIADISNLIQTGIGGAPVTQMYVADRIYNVTVRFPKDSRNGPEALGNLLLTASSGARIPLSQLAHIRAGTGESTITHESTHRQLTVRLDYADRDLLSYYKDAQARVASDVQFDHSKYRLEWAGQFENQERAQARLIVVFGLVLGLMALILYAGFGKLRQAMLILGVVPLAALGGLIALRVTGNTINVATGVGFIALFGVAVQNGIIMVSNINRVRQQGVMLMEAVLAGASERFRPVLMTATVASVGMLPAALATGVGTDVQRGLATVVVGGLVVATLLTLFILPTFYFALERWIERRKGVSPTPDGR